jgi:DNA-binding transcriptional ArsR family regulator
MKLDDAAAHLEALGNPTRLKIYRALVRAGDAGMPVGRLQDKLKIAPSTLSHHIKTLMVVGLINQVRNAAPRVPGSRTKSPPHSLLATIYFDISGLMGGYHA